MLTSVNAYPAFRPPRLEGTPRILLTGAGILHLFVPILTCQCMLSTYTPSISVLLQISVVHLLFKAGRNRQGTIAPGLPSNFIEESAP
jgi:hypothetical protein